MFYTVYEIRHKRTGKMYVGVHRTHDLNDGYMGSGAKIKSAVRYHGERSFTKRLLAVYDNYIDMMAHEAEIVTEDFIRSPTTYNIQLGGRGYCERRLTR